jgi:hypothetical protein
MAVDCPHEDGATGRQESDSDLALVADLRAALPA